MLTQTQQIRGFGSEFLCLGFIRQTSFLSPASVCLYRSQTHRRLLAGSRKKKTAADKNKEVNVVGLELELPLCCKVKVDKSTAQLQNSKYDGCAKEVSRQANSSTDSTLAQNKPWRENTREEEDRRVSTHCRLLQTAANCPAG